MKMSEALRGFIFYFNTKFVCDTKNVVNLKLKDFNQN